MGTARAMQRDQVAAAYDRWAPVYDMVFGAVFRTGRREAVVAAERVGGRILEVGVGTGLSLDAYARSNHSTGIDISDPMLEKVRRRVEALKLRHVDALEVMDAEQLRFPDAAFDVVVAQYVVTAIPNPERALDEFARVVRPGGEIILTSRIGAEAGLRGTLERWLMPVTSRLGWRTQFAWARYKAWVQTSRRVRVLERRPLPPLGHFWLIRLARLDDSADVRSDDAADVRSDDATDVRADNSADVRVGVAAHVRADDAAKATRFMGWFSRIEHPLVCRASLHVWRLFTELDLGDAEHAEFRSLHACFTRTLRDGARPFDQDPQVLASPCDAILGACGTVLDGQVLQVKGLPYTLADLLGEDAHARTFEGGQYATLRLTSGMYHRFHAPSDLRVQQVTHVPGDTWNVNQAALKRVPRLFCRNERALARSTLASGHALTLVPVAAILVAGIRLRFLNLQARAGRRASRRFACDVAVRRGEEMGWFEHGSTILVFAPAGFALCDGLVEGMTLRAGQALMRAPA